MHTPLLKLFTVVVISLLIAACGGGSGGSNNPARTSETIIFIADLTTVGQFELFRSPDDQAGPIRVNAALAANGDVFAAALSPDRQWIAFTAGAAVGTQIHLFAVPVSGGIPTQLSVLPNAFANVGRFVWSPDSTRIVYQADSDIDGVTELFLVNRDGIDNHKINGSVGTPPSVETVNAQWSDDSRFVAYEVREVQTANQSGSTLPIIGINSHDTNIGGRDSVRVSRPSLAGRSIKAFQWSSRSNLIAYTADFGATVGRDELYTAAPGITGNIANNPRINTINGGFQGVKNFSWAPDGIKLAYNALFDNTVTVRDIITIIVDASAATLDEIFANLPGAPTNNPIVIDQFWWSPDSNFVAFDADPDIADREELYVTDVAARTTAMVSVSPTFTGIRPIVLIEWSPNSEYVSYTADTVQSPLVRRELFSVRRDGTQHNTVSTVANTTGVVDVSRWSHDSQLITFHGDVDSLNISELYVSARDGTNQRKVSPTIVPTATGRGVTGFPRWSCDNQRVVFTIRQAPTSLPELFSASTSGNDNTRLHQPLFGSQLVSDFDGCDVPETFGAGS